MVINKKIVIASALFAALITPAIAFSSTQTESQTAQITINKAVGATPADAVTVSSSAAPVAPDEGTTGTNNDIVLSNVSAVNAWANHANWSANVYGASLDKSNVPLVNSLQVAPYNSGTSSCGSYAAVGSGSEAATTTTLPNQAKNSDNNAQVIKSCFKQPVSWADDAGAYDTSLTHQIIPGP